MHTIGIMILCIGLGLCFLTPIVHVLTRLERGLFYMADAQAQALTDLSNAVSAMSAAITGAVTQISALVAANANLQPDDSAAIEAQVTAIKTATAALVAAAPPLPTPGTSSPTPTA